MSNSPGKKGRRKFTVDALFQDTSARAAGVRDLVDAKEINIERISADPDQPRQTFDEDALAELATSIRREGVLQPIAVRYDEESDRYIIVHGERRWRAAQQAGLPSIPAIVRDVPEERRLIHQLMENVVREDLNAVDRAAALRGLKRQMDDAPWERVAEAVGIRRSRLFQLLSTEKLAEPVQERIRTGELSEKQTRALQGLSPVAQEALAELLVNGTPDEQVRDISRQLREDPDYLDLDDDSLAARIQELHASARPAEPSASPRPNPLVKALSDLLGERDLPDEPEEALTTLDGRYGVHSGDLDKLEHELQRVGYLLSRHAVSDTADQIPPKQLRALKRVIDGVLQAQKRN